MKAKNLILISYYLRRNEKSQEGSLHLRVVMYLWGKRKVTQALSALKSARQIVGHFLSDWLRSFHFLCAPSNFFFIFVFETPVGWMQGQNASIDTFGFSLCCCRLALIFQNGASFFFWLPSLIFIRGLLFLKISKGRKRTFGRFCVPSLAAGLLLFEINHFVFWRKKGKP